MAEEYGLKQTYSEGVANLYYQATTATNKKADNFNELKSLAKSVGKFGQTMGKVAEANVSLLQHTAQDEFDKLAAQGLTADEIKQEIDKNPDSALKHKYAQSIANSNFGLLDARTDITTLEEIRPYDLSTVNVDEWITDNVERDLKGMPAGYIRKYYELFDDYKNKILIKKSDDIRKANYTKSIQAFQSEFLVYITDGFSRTDIPFPEYIDSVAAALIQNAKELNIPAKDINNVLLASFDNYITVNGISENTYEHMIKIRDALVSKRGENDDLPSYVNDINTQEAASGLIKKIDAGIKKIKNNAETIFVISEIANGNGNIDHHTHLQAQSKTHINEALNSLFKNTKSAVHKRLMEKYNVDNGKTSVEAIMFMNNAEVIPDNKIEENTSELVALATVLTLANNAGVEFEYIKTLVAEPVNQINNIDATVDENSVAYQNLQKGYEHYKRLEKHGVGRYLNTKQQEIYTTLDILQRGGDDFKTALVKAQQITGSQALTLKDIEAKADLSEKFPANSQYIAYTAAMQHAKILLRINNELSETQAVAEAIKYVEARYTKTKDGLFVAKSIFPEERLDNFNASVDILKKEIELQYQEQEWLAQNPSLAPTGQLPSHMARGTTGHKMYITDVYEPTYTAEEMKMVPFKKGGRDYWMLTDSNGNILSDAEGDNMIFSYTQLTNGEITKVANIKNIENEIAKAKVLYDKKTGREKTKGEREEYQEKEEKLYGDDEQLKENIIDATKGYWASKIEDLIKYGEVIDSAHNWGIVND